MTVATFNNALKASVEVDRGSAPSSNHYLSGNKAPWWLGGRWVDVITDGLPNLQDRQATIFPAGHAGQRAINQQAPVVGRKFSDGDFSAPVVADFLGLLLYGALGSLSSNMVPNSANASLLNNEPIGATPKSLVLAAQPDGGGNIIRFDVKGTVPAAGATISISGIDAYGNGASESLTVYGTGLAYTRTSWSSIAASGIAISGLTAASLTAFGIKRFVHTFTTASSAPTFSIERVGTPLGGNAASRSLVFRGMSLKELTLNTPAETDDGLFAADVSWEGDPSVASAAASINAASPLKIWPAWTLQVTRNGNTWNVPTDFNVTIDGGNRNYKAAAGTQSPQGKFNGPQSARVEGNIILDNELEYDHWRGGSQMRLVAKWQTPWVMSGSQYVELSASMSVYLDEVDEEDADGMYTMSLNGVVVANADYGQLGTWQLINGIPNYGYGGTGI